LHLRAKPASFGPVSFGEEKQSDIGEKAMSLADLTAALSERVGEDSGLGATVKFDFGDDGIIFIDGASSPNSVSNEDQDAECTISMSMEDFESMTKGDLDPTTAFMMGKLKVDGNMGIAMKLSSVL
jgi:putative sterol carrier protein